MRRSIKALAAATVAAAITVAPAHIASADDRTLPGSTTTDGTGDATRGGDATAAQANAYDVRSITSRTRLAPDGRLFAEAIIEVNNSSFAADRRRVTGTFHFDAATDFTAVADVTLGPQNGEQESRLTVKGATVSCPDMNVDNWTDSNRFALAVPLTCLPSGGTFTVSGRVNSVKDGGGGSTSDTVSATTTGVAMAFSSFREGRMNEAYGDVDYGNRPGADRGAGRSIDLTGGTTAYTTTNKMLRVTFGVLDLSTKRYHVPQKFEVAFRNGSNKATGSVTMTPDLTGAGNHTFVASGMTCSGVKVVTFDGASNTVAFDVPRSCFGSAVTHVAAVGSAYDRSGTLIGHDTTPYSPLIALR